MPVSNGENPKRLPQLELDGQILNYKQNTALSGEQNAPHYRVNKMHRIIVLYCIDRRVYLIFFKATESAAWG